MMDQGVIPPGVHASGRADDRFAAFFRGSYAGAVRLAHLLTGTNVAAEDIAQEAFARLHRRFGAVEHPDRYLRTAVVNLTRDWMRRSQREQAKLARVTPSTTTATQGNESAAILEFVDRLPHRMRAVVVLRYWADLTEAEIAATLGCRPGTVKSLASRALVNLRKELST
jgi:RNA polymerase sigma-70 factor (sigma-E family)